MPSDIQITYINKSLNKDLPKIFVFANNELPSFKALEHGIAWKVIEDIGQDSLCQFTYPNQTKTFATWDNGDNQTKALTCNPGKRYVVTKNSTGIIIKADGDAYREGEIELVNTIKVKNGISAYLAKNDKVLVSKQIVAFGQKATFRLAPKLYWGIASEIVTSGALSSAVLDSDEFFEQNLENVTRATICLNGNAEEGYTFSIVNQE
ncbi:MAG: hypothetical protein ACJAXJ_003970 [Colwellia sp.]|jgi:hypothetical protein